MSLDKNYVVYVESRTTIFRSPILLTENGEGSVKVIVGFEVNGEKKLKRLITTTIETWQSALHSSQIMLYKVINFMLAALTHIWHRKNIPTETLT